MDNRRKTGMDACINQIGADFVEAHRDSASIGFQEMEDNKLFCFLGIDLHPEERAAQLSNDFDWDVYASCYVIDGRAEMAECKTV